MECGLTTSRLLDMRRRVLRWVFGATLIALGVTAWIVLRIISHPTTLNSGSYDCAIVLGAGVQKSIPSPVVQARIDHAVALYHQGIVRNLVFTGGLGSGDDVAESEAARTSAISQGIPPAAIHTERNSHTTLQNLREAKRIMESAGLRTAVIVSDPYHLRRADSMAADLGIAPTSSATPTTRYQSLSTKVPFLLRETYFTLHYWIFRE